MKALHPILVLWTFSRSNNGIIAGFSVILGWYCAELPWNPLIVLSQFICVWSIVSLGNIHNDIIDFKTDLINQPMRPIPSRQVSFKIAQTWVLLFLVPPIVSPILFHTETLGLSLLMIFLVFLYNLKLKGTCLWGNLIVSFLCACAILYPKFPESTSLQIILAGFAFLYTLAREIVKDLEDQIGDEKTHKTTTALYLGVQNSQYLAMATLSLGLVLSATPVLFKALPLQYFYLWVPGPLIFSLQSLYHLKKQNWKRSQKSLKFAMIAGMIAIFGSLLSR